MAATPVTRPVEIACDRSGGKHSYISLPEIGEYRVPIIFDNKKSNFSIKNLNHLTTTLLVFVSNALEPYFSLGKTQTSKFTKFILKLTLRKNIFRVLGDNFSIIGSPIVKSMPFYRIINRSCVFFWISSISMNLSPKTPKIFFRKLLSK